MNSYFLQIQVIEEDQKTRSCDFSTAQRGVVPPLVTTNFTVVDEGKNNFKLCVYFRKL